MATETFSKKRQDDRTRFGGLIYEFDFDTEHRPNNHNGSSIAQRIASDRKFDYICNMNIKARERKKEYEKNAETIL